MKICIDAGHGGHDSGAVARDGTKEKDIALLFAHELQKRLAAEHTILMTRKNDTFVGLTLRTIKANDWKADCFVSIHANAALNPSANGAWVIYDDDTYHGKTLALYIWREMARIPELVDIDPDEEVYPDNSPWVGNRELTVVSETDMPAVLVELGFLTNTADLADLKNPDKLDDICDAIADGIEAWGHLRGTYIPVPPVVDLAGDDHAWLPGTKKVERWFRPAQNVASPGEAAAPFGLRVINEVVESPEAQELLTGVKRMIVKMALSMIEKLLTDLVGKIGQR